MSVVHKSPSMVLGNVVRAPLPNGLGAARVTVRRCLIGGERRQMLATSGLRWPAKRSDTWCR